MLQRRLKILAEGIARSFEAKLDLRLEQGGYLPVENDEKLTRFLIEYAKKTPTLEFIETTPKMTGEDFGYLLSKIPGTMFWLGVNAKASLHSAHLAPDQAALAKGVIAISGFLEARMQAKEV